MKVASLFSGCGGLDFGLEQAGHQIILQCEADPGARQVLKEKFPGVLLVHDVCALERLPRETELLAAGFPCIDVSRAGLRRGLEGQSSGLVRHTFRLLERSMQEGHPVPWVLLENVEALLDRVDGQPPAIASICQTLEALGYASWAHRVISSAGFGVPNRRKRIFLIASLHGDARDVLLSQGMQVCLGGCCKGVPEEGVPHGPCYECWEPGEQQEEKQQQNTDTDNHNNGSGSKNGNGASKGGAGQQAAGGSCAGGGGRSSATAAAGGGGGGGASAGLLEEDDLTGCSLALDLGNARSAPGVDIVPTFTTCNNRVCLVLASGQVGLLRVEDAERLQGLPEGHTEGCWPVRGEGVQSHRGKVLRDTDSELRERARWALIGNAVTVQVGYWLGCRLADPYHLKYCSPHGERLMPLKLQSPVDPLSIADWKDKQEVRTATAGVLLAGNAVKGGSGSRNGAAAGMLMPGVKQISGRRAKSVLALNATAGKQAQHGRSKVSNTLGVDTTATGAALHLPAAGAPPAAVALTDGACEGSGQLADDAMAPPVAAAAATEDEPAGGNGDGRAVDDDNDMDEDSVSVSDYDDDDEDVEGEQEEEVTGNSRRGGSPGTGRRTDAGQQQGGGSSAGRARISRGWPRCAWYVRRLGRHAVDDVSEVPVKTPYAPLGDFIRKVGRAPESTELTIYCMRLREQGWDIRATVAKLQEAGAPLAEEVLGVARLRGEAHDATRIGVIVWARDPTRMGAWWPGEMLDPWAMPPGVTITAEQRMAMKPRERQMYLPPHNSSNNKTHAAPDASKQDEAAGGSGTAASGSADDGADAGGSSGQEAPKPPAGRRKVLVTYYGEHLFMWVFKDELLDYVQYRKEKLEAMEGLLESRMIKCGNLFNKAVQEADQAQAAKSQAALVLAAQALTGRAAAAGGGGALAAGASGGGGSGGGAVGGGATLVVTEGALLGQAAQQAAIANKMTRCGACESCRVPAANGARRRCLLVRATAAAAAGHTGAQLAVLGPNSVGARLSVWWPLDEAWYLGQVHDYDPLRVRHTVVYDDGDVEIIPLWAPHQLVRVQTPPSDWPAEAKRIHRERSAAARRAAEEQAAMMRQENALLLAAAEACKGPYERERDARLSQNRAMLASLMGGGGAAAAAAAGGGTTPLPTHAPSSAAADKTATAQGGGTTSGAAGRAAAGAAAAAAAGAAGAAAGGPSMKTAAKTKVPAADGAAVRAAGEAASQDDSKPAAKKAWKSVKPGADVDRSNDDLHDAAPGAKQQHVGPPAKGQQSAGTERRGSTTGRKRAAISVQSSAAAGGEDDGNGGGDGGGVDGGAAATAAAAAAAAVCSAEHVRGAAKKKAKTAAAMAATAATAMEAAA